MPNIAYEITQTIKPSYKAKYNNGNELYKEMIATDQFKWYKSVHDQLFWKEHQMETICFAEFHKNWSLHFHGIVIVPDNTTKLEIADIKKKCLKLGLSNFKPVSNLDSWNKYIRKDQNINIFPEDFYIESDGYEGTSMIALPFINKESEGFEMEG